MWFYIVVILLGAQELFNGIVQKHNVDREEMEDREKVLYRIDAENVMHEAEIYTFTVTGVITHISFIDLSKTSRVQHWYMHLYLKTTESSEELEFSRRALTSDRQLRVGQRVSITAWKSDIWGDFSDYKYAQIDHIEPL